MTEQKKKGGEFSTYLTTINDMYLPMIEKQMANNLIEFNDYAKRCVMNAMGAIQQLLDNAGLNFASDDLDQSNITTILLNVANLELNPVAQPRECYFTIRKVKKSNGKYKQMIEMGIEGDGHDAILSRFGRDVEKVYPHWLVREDDFFEYPKFNGLEMTPPKWEPKGTGEVVRVVYPILHTDKTLHFYIGERKDVMNNLMAHINNNMMNETFGICENRYNATPEQQAQIKAKKDELKAKAKAAGFDVLGMPEFDKYISPAWKENFASEQMIIRKMRNNITRKIPKQFNHPAVQESYDEVTKEGYYASKQEAMDKNAVIEVEPITPPDVQNAGNAGGNMRIGTSGGENTEKPVRTQNSPSDAELEARTKPDFD